MSKVEFREKDRQALEIQNCISLACAISGNKFDAVNTHLSRPGTTIHSVVKTASESHHKYVIAESEENGLKTIYVAFKATETKKDILTDVSIAKYTPLGSFDGNIHTGFYWEAMKIPLGFFISKLTQRNQENIKLIFTGHSLGGAIAKCVALTLLQTPGVRQERISVYTFGSPPIGDEKLAEFCNTNYSRAFIAFRNQNDIIPNATKVALITTATLLNALGGNMYNFLHKSSCASIESLQYFMDKISKITDIDDFFHFGQHYTYSDVTETWSLMSKVEIDRNARESIDTNELLKKGVKRIIKHHYVKEYYNNLDQFPGIRDIRKRYSNTSPISNYTGCLPDISEVIILSKYKIDRQLYCDLIIRGTNICHTVFWHKQKRCPWKLENTFASEITKRTLKIVSNDISREQLTYESIFGSVRKTVNIVDQTSRSWKRRIESMGIGELLNIGFMFSAYKFIDDQQRNRLCVIMDDLEKVAGNQDTGIDKIELDEAYEHFIKLLTGLSSVQDDHRNSQSDTDLKPFSTGTSIINTIVTATSDTMTYTEARRSVADMGAYELQQRLAKNVTLRVLHLLMAGDMSRFGNLFKKIGIRMDINASSLSVLRRCAVHVSKFLVCPYALSIVPSAYTSRSTVRKLDQDYQYKASLYLKHVEKTQFNTMSKILGKLSTASTKSYPTTKKIQNIEESIYKFLREKGLVTYEDVTQIRVRYENLDDKPYRDFIAGTNLWSTKEKVIPLLNILEVTMMVHEIRDIIGSYYVVGIIGDTRSGKSSFLYKLGFDSNPNASERMLDVKVHRTQTDSTKLVMVDFPGIGPHPKATQDSIYYNSMIIGTYVVIENIESAHNSSDFMDILAKHMIRTQDSSNYIIFLSHVDVYILDILKKHGIPTAKEILGSMIAQLRMKLQHLTPNVEIYPVCLVLDYNNLPAGLDEGILQSCGVLDSRRMMNKIKCLLNREGIACELDHFNYR
ncbi:hypothetical protein K7432_009522 [Basidiobolus ranarum]|uniref:Fungal lipase-type domain-containing protein n=1 Tax=Basidiobolus ranarum TaxID=34480 RepID=A0ABR2VWZ6_9FUNG